MADEKGGAKRWYLSRTLWFALAAAALSFSPLIEALAGRHPTIYTCSLAAAVAFLRVITTGGLKR